MKILTYNDIKKKIFSYFCYGLIRDLYGDREMSKIKDLNRGRGSGNFGLEDVWDSRIFEIEIYKEIFKIVSCRDT